MREKSLIQAIVFLVLVMSEEFTYFKLYDSFLLIISKLAS